MIHPLRSHVLATDPLWHERQHASAEHRVKDPAPRQTHNPKAAQQRCRSSKKIQWPSEVAVQPTAASGVHQARRPCNYQPSRPEPGATFGPKYSNGEERAGYVPQQPTTLVGHQVILSTCVAHSLPFPWLSTKP
jgi:hypothetical protein